MLLVNLAKVGCCKDTDRYFPLHLKLTANLLTTFIRAARNKRLHWISIVQMYIFIAKPVSFAQWGALLQNTNVDTMDRRLVAQETGFAPVWQMSTHPTLFASPVTLTAISSSNLPSFTWTSQIIVKKMKTNDTFKYLIHPNSASNCMFFGKWFVTQSHNQRE